MAGVVPDDCACVNAGTGFGGGAVPLPGSALLELAETDPKVSDMMVLMPSPYSSLACLLA
eukprot:7773584-Lingulodinium_polyedra.AAC.1